MQSKNIEASRLSVMQDGLVSSKGVSLSYKGGLRLYTMTQREIRDLGTNGYVGKYDLVDVSGLRH